MIPIGHFKFFAFLLLWTFTWSLNAQNKVGKSILFPEKSYTEHSLIQFRTIRNRDLPFTKLLDEYCPFPINVSEGEEANQFLKTYYARTIQEAFQLPMPDRAVLTDSLAPLYLKKFKAPTSAYRLFTSRVRRSDKIKRIRYAIKRGVPVLVAFNKKVPYEALIGQSHWDGKGEEGQQALIISGYDSKTASFQLLGTYGPEWGDKGAIWMTYLDLLSNAKEVLCLKNPTLSNSKKEASSPKPEILLEANLEILELQEPEAEEAWLKTLPVRYDEDKGAYKITGKMARSGIDKYQLKVHLKKGRCAYLFTVHPDGTTTPAWSQEYNHRDTSIALPPVSYYQFQEAGNENFILLLSYKPLPYWRKYVDYYEFNEKEMSVKEKLYHVFSRFLIPDSDVSYKKEELSASLIADPKAKTFVLPLIIEWSILD